MLRTPTPAARRFQLMALEHIEMRAKNIRDRREKLDLTQEEVADRMHDAKRRRDPDGEPDKTTGQMISDYERAVNDPSPPKLELLAEALETTVAELSARPADKGATPDLMATLAPDAEAGELHAANLCIADEAGAAHDPQAGRMLRRPLPRIRRLRAGRNAEARAVRDEAKAALERRKPSPRTMGDEG